MKQYDAKKILNIALAGHSGSGKTSVAESILYLSKIAKDSVRLQTATQSLILTVRRSKDRLQL